ncbi:hypothetical protein MD484_g7944, partial [Candolleomyces efflorescens]
MKPIPQLLSMKHPFKIGWLSLLLTALPFFVQAKVYESLDHLPSRDYDFIVVGGGIGGSVVASRLTEDPQFSVLLVEAGPNDEGIFEMRVPAFTFQLDSKYDWKYVTEPVAGLNNRTFDYARGHVLGGSTSINGMIYTRGAGDDYDEWARITSDPGWSWNSLFPLIKRHERWVPPLGGRDISGQYDPQFHGSNGNTLISLVQSEPIDFDRRIMQAVEELDGEFPFNLDQNSGKPIGVTWNQNTFGDGERSSAADAYLNSEVRGRPNLDIVVNTLATKVLPTGQEGSGGLLDIRTVELAPRTGGPTRKALTAKKEVVLAGGVFNTPHLLLNSGIGNSTELSELGITTIHDLPDVGKGMSDHHAVLNVWNTTGTPFSPPGPEALEEWKESKTGPLANLTFSGRPFIWARIPENDPIFEEYGPDPASGENAPHIEIIPGDTGSQVSAIIIMLTPKSRGSVTLRSSDPFDPPAIDLGYFTHPFDFEALRIGVSLAIRFFSAPVWSDYLTALLTPDPEKEPREVIEEFIRSQGVVGNHATGSAAMSARDKLKEGVVDPDLRVKGVSGLRIVDASVIPISPTAHPQAPVYLLAERAAELIREAYQADVMFGYELTERQLQM